MKLLKSVRIIMVLTALLLAAGMASAVVPERAKDFELKDLAGKTHRLSELKGSVVLINFWATWCAYCIKENPALDRLYTTLKEDAFHVLSISVDRSASTLEQYLKKNPLSFPVLLDSKGDVFVKLYTVLGIPVTYIIDREGYVVEKLIGEQDFDSRRFTDKIRKLLDAGGAGQ